MCTGCFPDLTHYANIVLRGLAADPAYDAEHQNLVKQSEPSIRGTPDQTTLFFGGPILTLKDHDLSPVDFLVVDTSGRIVFCGSEEVEARARASETGAYRTHDLKGATIVPGFVEPHVHLVFATLAYEWLVDLSPIARPRLSDVQLAITDCIASAKFPDGWVCGFGYDPSRTPLDGHPDLTRNILDPISPKNAVLVLNSSGHVAYINSVVFDQLVDKGLTTWEDILADPNYEKDKGGQPNGVIFEAAIACASRLVPFLQPSEYAKLADKVLQRWFSRGVTTIFDGGIGVTALDKYVWPLLSPTPMRLRASVWGAPFSPDDTNNWGLGSQVTVTSAKFWADGSTQGFTAELNKPYPNPPKWVIDDPPVFPTLDVLEHGGEGQNGMAAWYDAGFQLVVHSNGDKATDKVLQAYSDLFKNPPAKPNFAGKHRIEHVTVVSETQIEKIASTGKLSVSHTIGHVHYWGEAFTDYIFSNASISAPDPRPPLIDPIAWDIEHGLLWSMHSDSPVTPVDPLLYVRTALTRLTQQSSRVLGCDQRVKELVHALEGVTVNPAIQLGMFDNPKNPSDPLIGSLEKGKQADFVVLGRDPRTVEFADIHNLPIQETWIGGLRVFPPPQND